MSTMSDVHGLLPPDTLLNRRYRIIDLAGQGGMGAVYKAFDLQKQHLVAVKEMRQTSFATQDELSRAIMRFSREAQILHQLNHPNLPTVHDYFEERDRYYLVMDFINGPTLLELLKRTQKPLPINNVLWYAIQLCSVLDYLHRQCPPVIFRDLKPGNIMVGDKGHIYLIDFGIARFFKDGQREDTEAFGSVAYASPQQLSGAQTNVRSDLYSLGATLHHCLTEKVPAYADNRYVYPSVRSLNPYVPVALDALIMSLVEFQENRRPPDAYTVLQELEKIKNSAEASTVNLHTISDLKQGPLSLVGDAVEYSTPTMPLQPQPLSPSWQELLQGIGKSGCIWFTSVLIPFLLSLFVRVRSSLVTASGRIAVQRPGKPWPGIHNLISPARMKSGWQHMREHISVSIRSGASSLVLTPRFIAILFSQLIVLLIGCMFIFQVAHGSDAVVGYALSLFMLGTGIWTFVGSKVRDFTAKAMICGIASTSGVVALALQARPDVQQFISGITSGQFLAVLLIVAMFVVLKRPPDRLIWIDHLIVFALACITALFVYASGSAAIFIHWPVSVDTASTVTNLITFVLVSVALLSLARIARPFAGIDRWFLVLITTVICLLQFVFGQTELAHFPFFTSANSFFDAEHMAAYSYNIFLFLPGIVTLTVFFTGKRVEYSNRLGLLGLVAAVIFFVMAMGESVHLPFSGMTFSPFSEQFAPLFSGNQLFIWSAHIAALVLFLRFFRESTLIDRVSLFGVGLGIAYIQNSFWSLSSQRLQAMSIGSFVHTGDINLIGLNQILVALLFVMLFCFFLLACTSVLSGILGQTAWFTRMIASLPASFRTLSFPTGLAQRIMLVLISLIAALLVLCAGNGIPQLAPALTVQNTAVPLYAVLACIPGFFCLVALLRLFFVTSREEINWWDRLTLICSALICGLIFFTIRDVQNSAPPVFSTLQQVSAALFQSNVNGLILFIGLLAMLAISVMWLKRTPANPDYLLGFVFLVLFVVVGLCIVLQLLWPFYLLVALFLLIAATLIASQMERVR